jgi:hypothetical protein
MLNWCKLRSLTNRPLKLNCTLRNLLHVPNLVQILLMTVMDDLSCGFATQGRMQFTLVMDDQGVIRQSLIFQALYCTAHDQL